MSSKSFLLIVASLIALSRDGHAQNAAASATTIAVESEMISYEAVGDLAHQVKVEATQKNVAPTILFGSSTNLAAVGAYESFARLGNVLTSEYNAYLRLERPLRNAAAEGFGPISTDVNTVSTILSNLKASTTQTSATFAPVDQVLISDLEKEFGTGLVVAAYPGDYDAGGQIISKLYAEVAKARQGAIDALKKAHSGDKDKDKYDPLNVELKSLESVYSSFQAYLAGTAAPSVIQGAALISKLRGDYDVLTIQTAAAGGGDRANSYFLINLLFPAFHHSYNGGAAIAYTLRGSNGVYKCGGMLRTIYGYVKWHQPKLNKRDPGYANFPVTP